MLGRSGKQTDEHIITNKLLGGPEKQYINKIITNKLWGGTELQNRNTNNSIFKSMNLVVLSFGSLRRSSLVRVPDVVGFSHVPKFPPDPGSGRARGPGIPGALVYQGLGYTVRALMQVPFGSGLGP